MGEIYCKDAIARSELAFGFISQSKTCQMSPDKSSSTSVLIRFHHKGSRKTQRWHAARILSGMGSEHREMVEDVSLGGAVDNDPRYRLGFLKAGSMSPRQAIRPD